MGYPSDETFEDARRNRTPPSKRLPSPSIVCLCGSTRFGEAFRKANLDETLAGRIVLSVGCDFKSDDALKLKPEDKVRLDRLHLCKIDLADSVLILNVDGYIGESTARELAYAVLHNKSLRFLDPEAGERFMSENAHRLGAYIATQFDGLTA